MTLDCTNLKQCLELFNEFSVSLGVLIALFLYAKSQHERYYEKLNDHFLNFLELQLQRPGLGTNTIDRDLIELERTEDKASRKLIFDYLCSLLERAYLLLRAGSNFYLPWKRREWKDWNAWVEQYALNKNFVEFWRDVRGNSCFAKEFVHYVDEKVGTNTPTGPDGTARGI